MNFGWRVKPSLQVSRADLALRILLDAGTHTRTPAADDGTVIQRRHNIGRPKRLVGRTETQVSILPLFAPIRRYTDSRMPSSQSGESQRMS